jgi:hypothetical protein
MISMKFSEFLEKGQDVLWDHNNDPQVYVVRRGKELLYIGRAKNGIWERWFQDTSCHMRYDIINGENWLGYHSNIAEKIIKNLPEAFDWVFDLWTVDECLEFLEYEQQYEIRWGHKPIDYDRLRTVEEKMIFNLHPRVNVSGNNGMRDDELYERYFEFIKGWELIR